MSEIKIIPFESWHLDIINLREEQRYLLEAWSNLGVTPTQYGEILLKHAALEDGQPCAFSYYKDGEILGCGGIALTNTSHIAEAWCIFGEGFQSCYKTAVKRIKESIAKNQIMRLQATTEVDFKVAQRFLEFLGFEREGVLRRQGIDKKDNIIYSIIKE